MSDSVLAMDPAAVAGAPDAVRVDSPTSAEQHLVQERDALRVQNEQLWSLVEKQRQVIFSLKSQVERLRAAGAASPLPASPSPPVHHHHQHQHQQPSPPDTPQDASSGAPPARSRSHSNPTPLSQTIIAASATEETPAAESAVPQPQPQLHVVQRANTYPTTSADDAAAAAPPQQPQAPQAQREVPPPPRRATNALSITPVGPRMVAADHLEPLSPKPMVAGPASRASVISLNDPRYSYLAYYDDLTGDDDAAHELPPQPEQQPQQVEQPRQSPAAAAEVAPSAEPAAPTAMAPGASPSPRSADPHSRIVPANKAYTLGRLRPSSQFAPSEVRPTVKVQFAAETIIHEASDEEWSDGEDGDGGQGYYTEPSMDDPLPPNEDEDTASDMDSLTSSNVSQQPPAAAAPPAFPTRQRSSMMGASTRAGSMPPPRQHSRVNPRDSIYLTKNGYQPPRAYINETRLSMLGGLPSGIPVPGTVAGASPVASPTTAFPPRSASSGAGAGAGAPPMRGPASAAHMAAMASGLPPPRGTTPQPVGHPAGGETLLDEEFVRRLLSDRSTLHEQLKTLSPAQILQLKQALHERGASAR
ncbi:hypothetical protein H9P43_002218 [Blastocladiella emersonii ATCC 22665]|nr:hypothetical protein H9P43_002218 [Blastocladiella emersonii ATCC 22665]